MRARRRLRALRSGLALAPLLPALAAGAVGVTVENGASFALGVGTLAVGCGDLVVGGSFDVGSGLLDGAAGVSVLPGGALLGGSGTLRAAGPWSNAGSFSAGTGTVELGDGCGVTNTSILGSSRFTNLTLTTSTNKRFAFEAGSTQVIHGALVLSGAAGNLLRIRSTAPAIAFFDVQGTSSASYVDVEDNSAVPGNPIVLGSESIKGPGTWGWLLSPEIPALPALGLLAAGLGMAAAARRVRAPAPRREPG